MAFRYQAARRATGLLLSWLSLAIQAQPQLDLPAWSELRLELPPALTVKADLKTITADQARPELLERPGALKPHGKVYRLRVETRLKWFLSSKTWLGQLWMRPDLTALQRNRLKIGPGGDYKTYRYAALGVYRIRQQPNNPEQELKPPTTWPITNETFHAFPQTVIRRCAWISDPYAILLLLSQDWPTAETVVCLFNKEGVYPVSFQPTGPEPVQVNYRLRQGAKSHPVQALIHAERIRIHPLPQEADGNDPEPFEFLGMEGDIIFLRDPKTRLPLQIEGEVPGFGRAKLVLTWVKLR